jgi:pimeloyl-ACP methyl ester carboxylesterase
LAKTERIADAGHFVHVERYAQVKRRLLRHLQQAGTTGQR